MNDPIFVTKSFLPPREEYDAYLDDIWEKGQLTNKGPLLQDFERKVSDYLGIDSLQLVSNGTVGLQLAIEGLNLKNGDIITTPFSYVATTSAILWERFNPVFVDIDPVSFCIDPSKIEAVITPETKAILAVHVFGVPCDVDSIEAIANKHGLKVIYDAAHAFNVQINGNSIFNYGDVSVCSFHATKLFHTIEGGAVVTKSEVVRKNIDLLKRFGHNGDDHLQLGINGKASEFQAAMGLANLNHVDEIIDERKRLSEYYDSKLKSYFQTVRINSDVTYNYAYYPVVFKTEEILLRKLKELAEQNIFPRRYFYPSLNTIAYVKSKDECPVSEDIAGRIVCLPLYVGLEKKDIDRITEVLLS